jgi:hypothetical protein
MMKISMKRIFYRLLGNKWYQVVTPVTDLVTPACVLIFNTSPSARPTPDHDTNRQRESGVRQMALGAAGGSPARTLAGDPARPAATICADTTPTRQPRCLESADFAGICPIRSHDHESWKGVFERGRERSAGDGESPIRLVRSQKDRGRYGGPANPVDGAIFDVFPQFRGGLFRKFGRGFPQNIRMTNPCESCVVVNQSKPQRKVICRRDK